MVLENKAYSFTQDRDEKELLQMSFRGKRTFGNGTKGHEETLKEELREQSTPTLPPHYTVSPFVFVVMDVEKLCVNNVK